MAIDVQKEMVRRVTNGLTDLRHELVGQGLDVTFEVKETAGGLTVKMIQTLTSHDGAPAENLEDGEETVLLAPKKGKGG